MVRLHINGKQLRHGLRHEEALPNEPPRKVWDWSRTWGIYIASATVVCDAGSM